MRGPTLPRRQDVVRYPLALVRLGLVVLVTGVACAAALPAADAHNGIGAAFKGHPGNYIVWAYDGDVLSKTALEYRLVVLNRRTQQPVYNVHVGVTATWPGKPPASATITKFGNVFFYVLPNPYPFDWLIHLTLRGPLGTAKTEYKMHGAARVTSTSPVVVVEPASPPPWAAIIGGTAAALGLGIAGLVWGRRRRRSAAARLRSASGQSEPHEEDAVSRS